MSRFVYAFGVPGDNLIKIGCTGNAPASRATNLRCENRMWDGCMLFVEASDAHRRVERIAHDILREHRVEGEWFLVDLNTAIEAIKSAAHAHARGRQPKSAYLSEQRKAAWTRAKARQHFD